MSILDEFKKIQEEGVNISIDADIEAEIQKQAALIAEYDKNGTINGQDIQIKQSELNNEFPDGMDYECERNCTMDECPDGELVGEGDDMDSILRNFKNEYVKYTESDLTIIKSKDYEPIVVKAYCPKCGKEIINEFPLMFNPYTFDKICRYDCECGWKANLEHVYPRLIMQNKNTGEEIEVYTK